MRCDRHSQLAWPAALPGGAAGDGQRNCTPWPRRRGRLRRTARWASATAGWRSSTSRRRRTADERRATARFVIAYNGEIYNFRELRASWRRSATGSARAPTPRSCSTPTREWGDGGARRASTACSPSRSGTATQPRAAPGARPLWHQAALLRARGRHACCSPPRSRRCCAHPRVPRRAGPRGADRVFHIPEFLHRPHAVRAACACCPPGALLTVSRWRRAPTAQPSATGTSISASRRPRRPTEEYIEELDRLFRRRSSGSSSATCPSAPTSPAAWTRARSRRSPRGSCPDLRTFTVGFDLARRRASSSASTSARRPSACRTCSRPSTTRWS